MTREIVAERACGRWVKARGGLWLKLDPSTLRGVPDRLAVLPGGVLAFAEMKSPVGRTDPLQDYRIAMLRALGVRAGVVRSVADLKKLVGTSTICTPPVDKV